MPITRRCSKTSAQQGHSQFCARSVLAIREHGKRARTPLADFFNSAIKHCLNITCFSMLVYGLSLSFDVLPAIADMHFTASMNSEQEVSHTKQSKTPHTSDGTGQAQLTYHADSKKVCYTIRFEQLVGKEIEVHVHAPAPKEGNAPVLFFIAPQESGGSSPIGSPKNGCIGPLNKQELRWLKREKWYINIHTDEFPGGEIRGQVLTASEQTE